MPCKLYAIFHLNLAFSSIDECEHREVVKRCYWPLLNAIEKNNIPLAIELSIYTLECIAKMDSEWINRLRDLIHQNRCEVLASGDSQIIGPLVPADVNLHNLQLGLHGYERWLGITPAIAYVNEQAISAGVLDLYIDLGFKAVVVEWDNPYSHNPDWTEDTLYRPQRLRAQSGRSIPVIWNRAITFQKLQRYAHGEYTQTDYLDQLKAKITPQHRCISIYGNDAEVFDYRPGRYTTEAVAHHEEWARLESLFNFLDGLNEFEWQNPSELLSEIDDKDPLNSTNAAYPISVKKQAKYNITRWAVSGWNDLYLNSLCYKKLYELRKQNQHNKDEWQSLCRLWASDLRTHLTEKRYSALALPSLNPEKFRFLKKSESSKASQAKILHEKHRHRIYIETESVKFRLNTYRGLSIESLAFAQHDFNPVCGTLPHGYFDHISFGADYYSNHQVMERFRERDRITDLNQVEFDVFSENDVLLITTEIPSPLGKLHKWYRIRGESLSCGFRFDYDERPECSLRLGYITLLNCEQRCWYSTHLGGETPEFFSAESDFDHGSPVSSLISANCAVSATEGICCFGSGNQGVQLSWNPSQCAALVLLSSKKIREKYLNRLCFSLVEADETLKAGGVLPAFEYSIAPTTLEKLNY